MADPRLPALVMEAHGSGVRYNSLDNELIAFIQRDGFSACTYDPFDRRLRERDRTACNTVFSRDHQAVEARLRSARRYRLVNGEI
jgi:YD repeat-containing protein